VRELLETKPDELWVIQINPTARADEPRSVLDITDRRNELAGNLSLYPGAARHRADRPAARRRPARRRHLQAGRRAGPRVLLQPEQHLRDDQRGQPAQADLTAVADRRFGRPPELFVHPRVAPSGLAQPQLVRLAVDTVAVAALLGTRGGPRTARSRTRGGPADVRTCAAVSPNRMPVVKLAYLGPAITFALVDFILPLVEPGQIAARVDGRRLLGVPRRRKGHVRGADV
jgi:hypothetical protein